jgi:hypothetical protein
MKAPASTLFVSFLLVSSSPLTAGIVFPSEPSAPILEAKVSAADLVPSLSNHPSIVSSDLTSFAAPSWIEPDTRPDLRRAPVRELPEPIGIIASITAGAICLLTYRRLGKRA